jgi:hypothetical protein
MKSLALCTILASGFALAACGGDDEGDDDGAEPDASTAPSVSATAANTSVVAGSAVNLQIDAENFTLEAPVDQPNADGHGHYHVYLDNATGGDYLAADASASVAVTIPAATSAGAHTLKVQLFNNDHSALSPEVSDTVDITVAVDTAAHVTASANPTTVTAGGDPTSVTIGVTNFTFVDPTTHTNPVAGEGHYHIFLDADTGGDYLVNDYRSPVNVSIPVGTAPGAHTLRVALFDNVHAALAPAVEDIINITVE